MNTTELSNHFSAIKDKYDQLGINLVQALSLFMKEQGISTLSINNRTKDKKSFLEKVKRKKYNDPFNEIEDICGIRVICYYQSDVKKICDIISKEFDIIENQDKENLLNSDQFGYRSTHFIVKIKNRWLQAPNYRGLENLKAEIQVRTILMHAWAEIEHKLAYKSETQVPKQFKRKLFIMSAKLEEADEQFEAMKVSINDYKTHVKELAEKRNNNEFENVELNLDSLQTFLDLHFPNRQKEIEETAYLVNEFIEFGINLQDLNNSYHLVKNYLPKIEKEVFEVDDVDSGWAQVGIARAIMDLTNENWRENRDSPDFVKERDREWSKIIEKEQN